jgi:hypothetical protein
MCTATMATGFSNDDGMNLINVMIVIVAEIEIKPKEIIIGLTVFVDF